MGFGCCGAMLRGSNPLLAVLSTPRGAEAHWLATYHDMGLIGGLRQPVRAGLRCRRIVFVHFGLRLSGPGQG
jgi:hypothetical protein